MDILQVDGFIIFVEGKKGSGKTNFAMLLAEISHAFRYRDLFATNIQTECYYMKQIANYPDLKDWLEQERGKKLYILDEAGKHIKRLRFMSEQNTQIMDLLQLIRHYDAGLIGIAPSARFIDTNFLNTDILDARIRKISLQNAKIADFYHNDVYFIHNLPKTSILHNSKDIASFSMERKINISELPLCCQIAKHIVDGWKPTDIQKTLNLHREEYKRELKKHLTHSFTSQVTATQEVSHKIEGTSNQ